MTEHFSTPKRPLEHQPNALIVGASSGIGAALATALAHKGYNVALVARREPQLAQLAEGINRSGYGKACFYTHDVTAYEKVPALFQQITHDLGGLDLIAYVAGVMPTVAASEYNFAKDQAMIEVNVLGAMAWLNQAAVRFERAGQGHIVGIGSVAGDRGRRGMPAYHTSKAALHTYLESLRNRLTQHGVTVTTIKPGMVETPMLDDVDKKIMPITAPDAAAQIIKAIERKKQTVYIPAQWGLISLIIRHIPSIIFRRLNF